MTSEIRGFIIFCVMGLLCCVLGIHTGMTVTKQGVYRVCQEKGFYEISDSKFIECAAIDLKEIYTKGRE